MPRLVLCEYHGLYTKLEDVFAYDYIEEKLLLGVALLVYRVLMGLLFLFEPRCIWICLGGGDSPRIAVVIGAKNAIQGSMMCSAILTPLQASGGQQYVILQLVYTAVLLDPWNSLCAMFNFGSNSSITIAWGMFLFAPTWNWLLRYVEFFHVDSDEATHCNLYCLFGRTQRKPLSVALPVVLTILTIQHVPKCELVCF